MTLDGATCLGEVQYFFHLQVQDDLQTVAMVSVYEPPSETLLGASRETFISCRHGGEQGTRVVDAKAIEAVVGMVPHKVTLPEGEASDNRYYLVEKPGLPVASLGEAPQEHVQERNDAAENA